MMALKAIRKHETRRSKRRHLLFYVPPEKAVEYDGFFEKNPHVPTAHWIRTFVDLGIELVEQKGFDPTTLRPKWM